MPLHHALGFHHALCSRFLSSSSGILRKQWLRGTSLRANAHNTEERNSTDPVSKDYPDYREQSPQSLSKLVRKAMRGVPHPVTVITASEVDTSLVGLLVSSFNTVTLHPEPLVSFNIKLPSSTYDQVAATGEFTATSIWSIETANTFTKPLSHREEVRILDSTGMIQGAIFSFRCSWLKEKSVEVGDHMIMVGRVTGYTHVQTLPRKAPEVPLMYCNGKYRKAP